MEIWLVGLQVRKNCHFKKDILNLKTSNIIKVLLKNFADYKLCSLENIKRRNYSIFL